MWKLQRRPCAGSDARVKNVVSTRSHSATIHYIPAVNGQPSRVTDASQSEESNVAGANQHLPRGSITGSSESICHNRPAAYDGQFVGQHRIRSYVEPRPQHVLGPQVRHVGTWSAKSNRPPRCPPVWARVGIIRLMGQSGAGNRNRPGAHDSEENGGLSRRPATLCPLLLYHGCGSLLRALCAWMVCRHGGLLSTEYTCHARLDLLNIRLQTDLGVGGASADRCAALLRAFFRNDVQRQRNLRTEFRVRQGNRCGQVPDVHVLG
jgi:hypothetical protein